MFLNVRRLLNTTKLGRRANLALQDREFRRNHYLRLRHLIVPVRRSQSLGMSIANPFGNGPDIALNHNEGRANRVVEQDEPVGV